MKTPEQIAIRPLVGIESRLEELGITITSDIETAIKHGITAAIEADRAQREHPMSDLLAELQEWASTVSMFMAEDKSNDWSEEIAQLEEIERRLEVGK